MKDDRTQIEDIKSRTDIVPLVERYVTLRKTGKNYIGLCPFHNEKTPSFTVSPSIQLYKCFGCGESGDAIKFVEKIENLDFIEALEKLAKEAGIELQKGKRDKNSIYTKISEINELAAVFFAQQLSKNQKAKNYLLKDRKINQKSIETFRLGYAPGGSNLLYYIKEKKKYTDKELLESGLFTNKQGIIRDRFFERIIFPIQNAQGYVMGFTGRNLPDSKYEPKYLHTPETPLFRKSQLMYGLYQSKTYIRENDLCIVCEGTTDAIATHQKGTKNIVAPLGTAITEEQLKLLSRYTKNILIVLDNDDAGKAALERYFFLGIPLDLNLYTNTTEPYKDLDEMMMNESNKITEIIRQKTDLFSHLVIQKLESKNIDNHKDYKEMIEYISHLLSHVKDKASREFFMNKAQQITTIDSKFFDPNTTTKPPEQKAKQKTAEKLSNELFLLALIIYFEDYKILQNLDLKFILDSEIREILEFIQTKQVTDESKLAKHFENSELLPQAILESAGMNIEKQKEEKYILNTYSIIKKQNIEKLIQKLKLKERIAIEQQEEEKIDKIEEEIMRLKKLLQETNL